MVENGGVFPLFPHVYSQEIHLYTRLAVKAKSIGERAIRSEWEGKIKRERAVKKI